MLVALSRNRLSHGRAIARLRVADLEIDALYQRIQQGTRDVRLTPYEHVLLYTLAASAGVVITYRGLANAMGKIDAEIRNNTIARHVATLRRKLQDDPDRPRYIETVPGLGYRMPPSAPRAAKFAAKVPRTASRILVVEDDRDISRLLRSVLGDDGYRVAAAVDGELALEACAIEDPALILLDLNLPGMDGAEFLQAYRAHTSARAKVMVISGAAQAAEFARKVAADAFMAKPFDIEVLLRTVRRLLPGHPRMDAA